MKIHWTFRGCESQKQEARAYFEGKLSRLTRRLSHLGADRCRLDLTLYHHGNREIWELRALLRLPTGTLVTVEERHDLHHVVDEVVDELTRQLRRHKACVRREHVIRRRRHRGRELVAAASYLERDVAQDRREEFFELLSPLLDTVREHAEYELRVMEDEEAIAKGELSVDDLVDEVLLLAYDRFKLRPPESLMEAWLMELLHERLSALSEGEPPVSLVAETDLVRDVADDSVVLDVDDVSYWMSYAFDVEDDVRLEELVPDDAYAASLRDTGESEKQLRLTRILARLPKRQRQALMLHEASGFETAEIAAMLRIADAEVQRLIDQARATLRKNLAELSELAALEKDRN